MAEFMRHHSFQLVAGKPLQRSPCHPDHCIRRLGSGSKSINPLFFIHKIDLRVPNTLVEIWQANAGGRYRHKKDMYLAPIDPNFGGCGRTMTDEDGYYFFRTVKPGAYPWRNWVNSWRPAHVHVSVFGTAFAQRLITQLYFEGDPLIKKCAIVNTIPDQDAIDGLIAPLDMNAGVPLDCLAYKFDIVLRGRRSTLFENRLEGN